MNRVEATRTGRALLTFVATLLTQVAQAITNFVVLPLILAGLGNLLFGAWQMINQTVNYLAIADLRALGALKFTLATQQYSNDYARKRRQVGASLAVAIGMMPVLIGGGLILVAVSPQIIRTDAADVAAVQSGMLLAVFNMVLSKFLAVPGTVLSGSNLAYKGMGLQAVAAILVGVLGAVAVRAGWSLPGLMLASLVGNILVGVVNYLIAARWIPWLGADRPSSNEVKDLTKFSVWLMISNLATQLLLTGDIILVGIVLSPVSVTLYALTKLVMEQIRDPFINLFSSGFSGIGDLVGREQWAVLNQVRIQMQSFSVFIMTPVGAGIIALNRSFLALWIGQEGRYAGDVTNVLLVIMGALAFFIQVDSMIIDATLNLRRKTMVLLINGVISVVLGVIFLNWWGLAGMALAMLVARIILIVIFPEILSHKFQESVSVHYSRLLRPVMTALAVYAAALIIEQALSPRTWLAFGASAIAIGVTSAAIGWWIGLGRNLRRQILNRFPVMARWQRLFLI